ncbi:MAG TPA: cytochrome b/b6 domain-containing protein [Nocardioides sp.]|uniref:cytochrome b n=1 Tax=Nocardioides sp. TaxID=35761 RepID=UPI002E2EA69A|nr:cytochrome b/b6 domain-containing protein [Nocardioides sp.]HEX5086310.1 cytochrome b/b6 domain-containing protein [Nocardioides sp.]
MPLRNGQHGYGAATKLLHWLTVGAITGQFLVGYSVRGELDDHGGRAVALDHGHGGSGSDDDGGEGFEQLFSGGFGLPELHVVLGLSILALGVLRVLWRYVGSLPPWAPSLSNTERTLEGLLEKALLALLFLIPISGLLLVGTGEDDYLPLHVAAHVAFFVALGLHLALVLKHTVIHRDRHLARML